MLSNNEITYDNYYQNCEQSIEDIRHELDELVPVNLLVEDLKVFGETFGLALPLEQAEQSYI